MLEDGTHISFCSDRLTIGSIPWGFIRWPLNKLAVVTATERGQRSCHVCVLGGSCLCVQHAFLGSHTALRQIIWHACMRFLAQLGAKDYDYCMWVFAIICWRWLWYVTKQVIYIGGAENEEGVLHLTTNTPPRLISRGIATLQ